MKKIYLKPQSRIFSVDAENLMAGSLGDGNGTTIDLGGLVDSGNDGENLGDGSNQNQFGRGDNGGWNYEW